MPNIHTHLHLGILLNQKVEIPNLNSFLLGNAYPDCFEISSDAALVLHQKNNWDEDCDLSEFYKQQLDSFTLGYFFHLWIDNAIKQLDLKDITKSDCLICDMEVLYDVLKEINALEVHGKEKQALENIKTLEKLPMPLIIVDETKKKDYRSILNQLVDDFIFQNKQILTLKSFKKMRRFKQELSLQETLQILEKGTSGTLALLDEQGYPYAVPLSYVYDNGKIYFHSAKSGHKIDAINHHPKASFCVIDQDEIIPEKYTTYFRSAIVFGEVSFIEDETEKVDAVTKLAMKYSSDYEEGIPSEIKSGLHACCMIQFDIEKMSGKEAIELVNMKK